jgi:serpin B
VKYYKAVARKLDFSNSSSPGVINSWISKKTGGMIKKMIDMLKERQRLILINAIFFHGKWKEPFKKKYTSSRKFNLLNGKSVNHAFMYRRGRIKYTRTGKYQAVRLDYGEKRRTGIVILLPKKGINPVNLLKQLSYKDLKKIFYSLRYKKGKVYLPKFNITYGVKSIKKDLKGMGMVLPFINKADFSGMLKQRELLMIDDVVHKAKIDLNEKGTKAAAVTGVVTGGAMARPQKYFVFNAKRPFAYFIVDNEYKLIIFAGILNKPQL